MSVESETFEALYADHAAHVRGVAKRILRNTAEVEDVVHDVFLQAWRQLGRFDASRGNAEAWLAVITKSRVLDRLRRGAARKRAEPPVHDQVPPVFPDPGVQAEQTQHLQRIRGAWAVLAPETRRILELAHHENLSQRDIATQLHLTLGVVKSRMRQGLLTLRRELDLPRDSGLPDESIMEWALTVEDFESGQDIMGVHPGLLDGVQVLVVDDDRRTCDLLNTLLERAGAVVFVRRSAAEAWALLEHVWPDVLLADISMPNHDGYALMREVDRMRARTGLLLPAIAFTGRATEYDRIHALSAGFQLHVSKPVHPSVVIAAIRRVVAAPAMGGV